MFMKFQTCGPDGNPANGHGKVLINMKNIDNVTQAGRWEHRPVMPTELTFTTNPLAPQPQRAARGPDQFVIIDNCVNINCMQQNYTVIADFDELAAMLESLHSLYGE